MRYKGGVISATAPTTSSSAAPGIWTLEQQFQSVGASVWPRSPGAPTIGTATAGVASATVAFTAPTDLGAGTITYTATSSPGGFTGTGTSPITVSGLTNGTAYTFTVRAATPGGTGPASSASNSITPSSIPGAIGIAYGGGYFAGQISSTANGVATHNLVVSDITVGQNTSVKYYTSYPPPTTNSDNKLTGAENTTALVATYGANAPAAYFCENLNTGGYTDWYLPAANELEILYWFLKPTTDPNTNGIWANVNAVSPEPYNTNHTSGIPAQTTAADFQDIGTQDFATTIYLSSTQSDLGNPNQCYAINFYTAAALVDSKTTSFRCRAIRKVAV